LVTCIVIAVWSMVCGIDTQCVTCAMKQSSKLQTSLCVSSSDWNQLPLFFKSWKISCLELVVLDLCSLWLKCLEFMILNWIDLYLLWNLSYVGADIKHEAETCTANHVVTDCPPNIQHACTDTWHIRDNYGSIKLFILGLKVEISKHPSYRHAWVQIIACHEDVFCLQCTAKQNGLKFCRLSSVECFVWWTVCRQKESEWLSLVVWRFPKFTLSVILKRRD